MAKNVRYKTPLGKSGYCYLNTPDTKFNPEGVYRAQVVLPEAKARRLMAFCDKKAEESVVGKKVVPGLASVGYTENDNGTVSFTFKCKASGVRKDTKEQWTRRPIPIVERDGVTPVLGEDREFWSGSDIKVLFEANPFFTNRKLYGVSLRLIAVELHEGVYGGAGGFNDAVDFGEDEATDLSEDEADEAEDVDF
jgi:hypothetical protein